jgi:hypothetical protein
MTLKDGKLAKWRAQHSSNNAELVAAFEALSWNEEPEVYFLFYFAILFFFCNFHQVL